VAGLIVSAIVHYGLSPEQRPNYELSFSGNIFFYVCLPPIIFAAGFNMQRRRFFENIFYILLFGVVGTIVTFFIFSGLTYLFTMNSLWAYDNSL
jgi:sodium/hydrogen exchanger-like protein 6/7